MENIKRQPLPEETVSALVDVIGQLYKIALEQKPEMFEVANDNDPK